jgi:hypothetical protein
MRHDEKVCLLHIVSVRLLLRSVRNHKNNAAIVREKQQNGLTMVLSGLSLSLNNVFERGTSKKFNL